MVLSEFIFLDLFDFLGPDPGEPDLSEEVFDSPASIRRTEVPCVSSLNQLKLLSRLT